MARCAVLVRLPVLWGADPWALVDPEDYDRVQAHGGWREERGYAVSGRGVATRSRCSSDCVRCGIFINHTDTRALAHSARHIAVVPHNRSNRKLRCTCPIPNVLWSTCVPTVLNFHAAHYDDGAEAPPPLSVDFQSSFSS